MEPNLVEHFLASTLRVGHSLACKYLSKVEVTDNDKQNCVLRYENNYGRKKFFITCRSLATMFFKKKFMRHWRRGKIS